MHLFSPERPESSPGRKAILIDGSVVPRVLVMPLENGGYELMVMLRCYDTSAFSYSWHFAEVQATGIEEFFDNYCKDPEATLLRYFNWEPKATKARTPPITHNSHSYSNPPNIKMGDLL